MHVELGKRVCILARNFTRVGTNPSSATTTTTPLSPSLSPSPSPLFPNLLCLLLSPSPTAMANNHLFTLGAPGDSVPPPLNPSAKNPAGNSSSLAQNGICSAGYGETPNSSVQASAASGGPRCVGKDNRKVTWGRSADVGKRSAMEDSMSIVPGFVSLSCKQVGGCTAPDCAYASDVSPVHFFGLYDGHGGPQVSCYCANMLHEMVAEEWERKGVVDEWRKRWEIALHRAYGRVDDALKDKTIAPYSVGSTGLVVVVSACQIIAANCGDSRVVLCRGTQAIPLTADHKLDQEDELARIKGAGGQILYWQGPRVEGVLAMTRAIGDRYLKPSIISEPEITFTTRTAEDECLILASDGLWDVLSNEKVVKLARNSTREERRKALLNDSSLSPAHFVADNLLCHALAQYSHDNISIIVVDLKPQRRRRRYKPR